MSGIDLEEVRAIADDHEALGFVHAPRMMRFCAEEIAGLRSQLSALREALAKLNKGMTDYFAENPDSAWCVVAREGAEELAAALASTEPKGEP